VKRLEIYVDGACRGNPGPASYGVAIKKEDGGYIEFYEYIGTATNQVAEYEALIRGLSEAHKLGAQEVDAYTDSQFVTRQFQGIYKIKHETMKALMLKVRELEKNFKRVGVHHIPRSSQEGNKLADKLANIALDKAGK
jgi:ribonuclease HI